ncbi:uncharacterized protein Z518_00199 [Rhinocladiella mackenziei CBS 650.93]|uniref:Alpha N-terminal protein methyltransferase 1 n=1 Tax=Rhinocladiella mackenziei CBS 650.93 TaxID=1442369 RepID=A0A0D2J0E9_9EURO|nr:uncharacterized protein Z518_00199 [Rhinocladiella mackenziei CBS 650.93]KIX09121.1 hypothetical protein Z518_00199 [Rhinocladiella mackenziei CBS 650.93]
METSRSPKDIHVPLDTDTAPSTITNDSQISISAQLAYWQSTSADVNGMLGGYPQISRIDIQFSRNFIRKLRRKYKETPESEPQKSTSLSNSTVNPTMGRNYVFSHALEAGAGIGRVTLGLLVPLCAKIDIIEPVQKFTDVLTGPESPLVENDQLGRVWNLPLQEWTVDSRPAYASIETPGSKYDLVYNQWCLNHLALSSLVAYFKSLILLLSPNGWIIVKENLSTDAFGADIFDPVDSSVTRSDANWRAAFKDAGLKIVHTELQTGFPKDLGLYPVRMYALRPG